MLFRSDRGGPEVGFQLLVYPVTEMNFDTASYRENATGYGLTLEAMRWYWKQYLAEETQANDAYAAPMRASTLAGLPPALVITAEFDPLCDEGEAYAARLRDAGVDTAVTRYDGMIHGFFGMASVLDKGAKAVSEGARAVRQALGEPPFTRAQVRVNSRNAS